MKLKVKKGPYVPCVGGEGNTLYITVVDMDRRAIVEHFATADKKRLDAFGTEWARRSTLKHRFIDPDFFAEATGLADDLCNGSILRGKTI